VERERMTLGGSMLKRWKVRELITNVPQGQRSVVSRKGKKVLGTVVPLHYFAIQANVVRAA
jgi:hypothetical protein